MTPNVSVIAGQMSFLTQESWNIGVVAYLADRGSTRREGKQFLCEEYFDRKE
jgi:hypothetical protein